MPLLIAIGGHIGTGKTSLAYGLRRTLPLLEHAVVMDDDRIRRELLGASLRMNLRPEDYSPEVSGQVREIMQKRTAEAFRRGLSVINHAGFFSEAARSMARHWADAHDAQFIGLWLVAPRPVMEERIRKRLLERESVATLLPENGHASDADIGVIDKFRDIRPPHAAEWHIIDADIPLVQVIQRACRIIESYPGGT